MNGHRAPSWSATVFLIGLLACAFGMAAALDRPREASPTAGPIRAVYLTAGRSPVLTPANIRATGLRPVTTFAAAQAQLGATDALIIDRELLSLVPPLWLAQQQRAGRLLIGMNIPMVELGRLAEYAGGTGGYLDNYGGRDFYSYLQDPQGCRPRPPTAGMRSGSDAVWGPETFFHTLHQITTEGGCDSPP